MNAARQRGAATAVFVLLLLALVAFLGLTARRMAGSDALDTDHLSADAEALFLAESALERAAWRFLDGTACADLAPDGPYTLGRGSLEVLAGLDTGFDGSPLPAARCRIRVRGSVGQVRRTLEAIAQRPGGSGGVIVDPGFDDPARWDDGEDIVAGGVATFTEDDDEIEAEKKDPDDPENGIAEIDPPPGVVPLQLSFDYQVTGVVDVEIKIKFKPGGGGTLKEKIKNLSGSGTYTVVLGDRDPNLIEEVEIKVKKIKKDEVLVMDNFYLGPEGGGGAGGAEGGVMAWRQAA